MQGSAVLLLQDVTLRYGGFVAVDALCLEVARGEVFGLLGPNGCGKSSTLAAVSGGLAPSAGVIRVGGLTAAGSPDAYRRLIGLVPQELAVYDDLSAADNLRFFGGLYGLRGTELRDRVGEALAFVRLEGHARRPPRTFSGGMQRRLNLACALLHRPALLLLDEPTVGLDIQSREAIFDSLRRLRDEGRAVVITTHHLEEAEQLCDRVGIMDGGRLVALGSPAELAAALPPPYADAARRPVLLDADTEAALRAALGPHAALGVRDGRLVVVPVGPHYYTDPPREDRGAPAGLLARVFLELTGRSPRDG